MRTIKITRRTAVAAGLTAMAYSAAAPRASVRKGVSIRSPLVAGLWVRINFPGDIPLKFDQPNATDLGNYNGVHVHQCCFIQRSGPWTVFFRPDADGNRDEVVIEYGIWPVPQGIVPGHIQQRFTVRIGRGDILLATVLVPAQYWMTRWRWQSAPRSIICTAADLKAMRAILPPDSRSLYGTEPTPIWPKAIWTGPMGTAGLATAMGMAGGRPEIGPITEPQAVWLINGTDAARVAMMAQAEAVGSLPIWLRDTRTNALLDVYANPGIGLMSDAGPKHAPIYPTAPKDEAGKIPANFFKVDTSHYIPIVFVPWLLTDDPYFLEGCQAGAVFQAIFSNGSALNYKLPGICSLATPRAWAWGVREVARMAAFSPDRVPSWLLPRTTFKKMVGDNLAYAKLQMTSNLKCERIFHIPTDNNGLWPGFHLHYLATTLGWMKWSGKFPEWDEAVEWYADPVLRQMDAPGTGGFDRRWPCPYYIAINNGRVFANDPRAQGLSLALRDYDDRYRAPSLNTRFQGYEDATPDSLPEAWQLFLHWQTVQGKPLNLGPEDRIYQNPTDNPWMDGNPGYQEQLEAALAAYSLAGVAGARERWQWLRDHMPALYTAFKYRAPRFKNGFNWALWPQL